MTIEEKIIFKYRADNLISNDIEIALEDVLYEEHGTDRSVYLQRVNAFCDTDSNITLAYRNGVKTVV